MSVLESVGVTNTAKRIIKRPWFHVVNGGRVGGGGGGGRGRGQGVEGGSVRVKGFLPNCSLTTEGLATGCWVQFEGR